MALTWSQRKQDTIPPGSADDYTLVLRGGSVTRTPVPEKPTKRRIAKLARIVHAEDERLFVNASDAGPRMLEPVETATWAQHLTRWLAGRGATPEKIMRACAALHRNWADGLGKAGYHAHVLLVLQTLVTLPSHSNSSKDDTRELAWVCDGKLLAAGIVASLYPAHFDPESHESGLARIDQNEIALKVIPLDGPEPSDEMYNQLHETLERVRLELWRKNGGVPPTKQDDSQLHDRLKAVYSICQLLESDFFDQPDRTDFGSVRARILDEWFKTNKAPSPYDPQGLEKLRDVRKIGRPVRLFSKHSSTRKVG